MLLGILGRKGAGKDLVSDYIVKRYNYKKLALATPIKNVCRILFNFSEEQLYGNLKETIDPAWGTSPRIVMQYLGTDILRKDVQKIMPDIKDNFWIKSIMVKCDKEKQNDPTVKIVISDVRFLNEAQEVRKAKGKIIKLIRPTINNNDAHESEKNIDTIEEYDYLIINDGTKEELFEKINAIIAKL